MPKTYFREVIMSKNRKLALAFGLVVAGATFVLPVNPASASVECPTALHNLGCIADFDPNPGGGGSGKPYYMMSIRI